MTWRVARSLDVLLNEINEAAPNRNKISDGSIGDAAHASRDSDHNPWVTVGGVGIVRARDFTHDPGNGCDAGQIAERVRLLAIKGHPALESGAYVIWNRRIASATYGWTWRAYSGSNPHAHHCHVSVSLAASGFDSTARWGVMTTTPKGLRMDKEVKAAFDKLEAAVKTLDGKVSSLRVKEAGRHKATIRELRQQGKTDAEILAHLEASE